MLKKSFALALTLIVGVLFGLAPSQQAQADAKIYTQPGDHHVNGRYWNTECENYSSTVIRCSTEIWATKITKVGGHYVADNGWVFNNLTYLPSNPGDWGNNPLANPGKWTDKDGRTWRTECNTATTGHGACRTYSEATTITRSKNSRGHWSYSQKNELVFNNIVTFATDKVAPVTSIPAPAPALSGVPQENSSSATAQQVVQAALGKVGSSYRHAAAGPSAFDCSGLTSWAYSQAGISLPRNSRAQFNGAGTRISKSQLQPGDLVFYYSPVSHVAIYIGDGKIVDAANRRTGVRVTSVNEMPFSGAVRVIN